MKYLSAVILVVASNLALAERPVNDDIEGIKAWINAECRDVKDGGLYRVPETGHRTDDNLVLLPTTEIREVCGRVDYGPKQRSNNSLVDGKRPYAAACYLSSADTMYFPEDGGVFVVAPCHEKAHSNGTYSHHIGIKPGGGELWAHVTGNRTVQRRGLSNTWDVLIAGEVHRSVDL